MQNNFYLVENIGDGRYNHWLNIMRKDILPPINSNPMFEREQRPLEFNSETWEGGVKFYFFLIIKVYDCSL